MSQKHAIRLPGLLLDELKTRDYDNDERFQGGKDSTNRKRRSNKDMSRKQRRKQQRLDKKGAGLVNTRKNSQKGIIPSQRSANKLLSPTRKDKEKKEKCLPDSTLFPPDDELDSEDFENFDDDDLNEEEREQLHELEREDLDEDEVEHELQGEPKTSQRSKKEHEDDNISAEDSVDEHTEMTVEETMAALKALKQKKQKSKKLPKKDNLEATEGISEDDAKDRNDSNSETEKGMTVEETMAALKALKQKKQKSKKLPKKDNLETIEGISEDDAKDRNDSNSETEKEMTVEETMAALKSAKQKKDKSKGSKTSRQKKERKSKEGKEDEYAAFPLTPSDRAAIERDEMDMQYYAKRLGIKGKSKRIHARDEYDAIGGLLEGLDFIDNYGGDDEEYGEYGKRQKDFSDEEQDDESAKEDDVNDSTENLGDDDMKMLPSDDELSSGDFDEFDEEDLDEEEWAQLRELEGDGSDNDDDANKPRRKRENPLVAPVEADSEAYVPPSLRKKALDTEGVSVTVAEIKKQVKSLLNKLSDSNIAIIISSLNDLYEKYARQYVTEAISSQLIEIIGQGNKLLDSFVMNYSAVVFALWRLRGAEVGATFIQTTIEFFLERFEGDMKTLEICEDQRSTDNAPHVLSKEASNILGLLSYCYNFGVISCNIIYDLIRLFVVAPNEYTTELLLKVISISGPLIRGDDASALKEIISQLLDNVKTIKRQTPRLKFLLDTLSDLKNNRLKPSILAASHQLLKKTLQSILLVGATSSEPLLVSLEDIKNVQKKGKWWLIGASWRGNMANESAPESTVATKDSSKKIVIEDDLLDDIPDWSAIAKQQRMNTDVRRAIFVSIMSAQDYMDAFSKLEKLNLKNKQTLEIPRVLLHCLAQDSGVNGYNPYYGLIALKLCENHHSLCKSFQFLFWDIVKTFEDEQVDDALTEEDAELDDDTRLKHIANKGKFFGYLIAEGILQLDIFKHVSLITGLVSDGVIFVEFLMFQLLLTTAKKSEVKKRDSTGKKTLSYKNDTLVRLLDNGIKLENRSVIMKGLLYFTKKNLKYKKCIPGGKKSKNYERDVRRMEWAVPKFIEIIEEGINGF